MACEKAPGHGAGFPAHAGIDLVIAQLDAETCGFPRPRGDRPSILQIETIGAEVSPPTRG